ncbi:hypothetical protein ACFL5K_03870 [Gemmatimonadota bacterium]
MKTGRMLMHLPGVLLFSAALFLLYLFSPTLAANPDPTGLYKEDINWDGNIDITDVVSLLLMSRKVPDDPEVDYNGDGKWSISDAIALLINIRKGNLQLVEEPAADSWRVLGPGGGGGMFTPTIDPFDPSHIFVRCDMTGAYVTFDDGDTWRMFNLRTGIADFEFDPNRQGTVYAGNTGLYRSEDGGVRWQLIYPDPADVTAEHMVGDHAEHGFETLDGMPDAWIAKIRVDPADSDHIWLGLRPRWDSPAKLLVSDNRGATWRVVSELSGGSVLAIFPGSWWDNSDEVTVVTEQACLVVSETSGEITNLELPDTLLLSADGGKGEDGAVLYVLSAMKEQDGQFSGGPYRSTDGGQTWANVISGLTSTDEVPAYNVLAACQNLPEVVYLSCESYPENRYGILKTDDSGKTWSWVLNADWNSYISNNYSESWLTRNYGTGYVGRPHELGVCPTDPDVCFAADGHSSRTTNGGETWETVYSNDMGGGAYSSRGLDVTTCYGVHFDPFDSLHLFITYTDIGLFQSYDGGESWVHALNGIIGGTRNTCYWLEFDPDVEGTIYSIWSNWHDLPRMKMFNDNWGDARGMPAISTDGGQTWYSKTFGAPVNSPITHILLDPDSPVDSRTLYICGFGDGVFKSTDGGSKWFEASEGLGENRSVWRITRKSDGTLFVVVVGNGRESNVIPGALYRSDDGAESWQKVTLPEGVKRPNDLAVDPSDSNIMYLSCWPWIDLSSMPRRERNGGLYRSLDDGASWEQVFYEDAHVYAAAIDPERPSTVVINTFDSAAFRTMNRGETWHKIGGYNFKWGHRPILDPHHPGMLYLTTFGGSVFYGPVSGLPGTVEDIEEGTFLRWAEMP